MDAVTQNESTSGAAFAQLGFDRERATLGEQIAAWIADADSEVRPYLEWQFLGGAKLFRPLTLLACCRAQQPGPIPARIMNAALAVELFHNVSLIIDDIVDHSDTRRDRATLHAGFGELPALMTAGFIVADCYGRLKDDTEAIVHFSQMSKRLAAAECRQWRLRRNLLGVEDWRLIATEDTGAMFEMCACLGDRSGRLRRYGRLLGLLYHGCDDLADVRGTAALGGQGDEDVRDGILTLPAALAIRDPAIAELFCKPDPDAQELAKLAAAFAAQLPAAEVIVDQIADEARAEARLCAADPAPLLALVARVRRLSEQ